MIYLDRKEKKPLYQQLYEAIIAEILKWSRVLSVYSVY